MSQNEEIEQMEKEFREAEKGKTSFSESVKTFTDSIDTNDFSKDDMKVIAKYLDKETIGVHQWLEQTPVIVKVLSECIFTESNKFEQFNAKIYMKVDGKMLGKLAKVNVFSGMKTQFQKHMKCFIKNTVKVNREDKTYQKKIKGHVFGMNYTGLSDSLLYKNPKTGKPFKTKSIVIRLLA